MTGKSVGGHWKKPAMILGLCAALTALAGCAATEAIPFPKLSSVKRITKRVLTREEKDDAIRDLTIEQKKHREEAERELEKR